MIDLQIIHKSKMNLKPNNKLFELDMNDEAP